MSKWIYDIAVEMGDRQHFLGALACLMSDNGGDEERRAVLVDEYLRSARTNDPFGWLKFGNSLVVSFQGFLDRTRFNSQLLVDSWVNRIRERGFGLLQTDFLEHIGKSISQSEGLTTRFAELALWAARSEGRNDASSPPSGEELYGRDQFELLKLAVESERWPAALYFARKRTEKNRALWDVYWLGRALAGSGDFDGAVAAYAEFSGIAANEDRAAQEKMGAMTAADLLPCCRDLDAARSKLREMLSDDIQKLPDFQRRLLLAVDVERFREVRNGLGSHGSIRVGHCALSRDAANAHAERLAAMVKVQPGHESMYELAKVLALLGRTDDAREFLLASRDLDVFAFQRDVPRGQP